MKRLRVRLMLPAEYAGGPAVVLRAGIAPDAVTQRLDVPRRVAAVPASWLGDGFLVAAWLGAAVPAVWLAQEWLQAAAMRGSWRLEAVSWPMHFGRVYLHGAVEQPGGDAVVISADDRTINESPAAPVRLRLAGQDEAGRIGLAVRRQRALE